MPEEKEKEKLVNEINEGIKALRDQQKVLEDAGTSRETQLTEQKQLIETITGKPFFSLSVLLNAPASTMSFPKSTLPNVDRYPENSPCSLSSLISNSNVLCS
ncbi:unnamed protein product, partial [marine sediment metagenome]